MGLASGRMRAERGRLWSTMMACSALAMLPDADTFLLLCGVADRGLAGHRGFTHTPLFALLVGAIAVAIGRARGWRRPPWTGFIATLLVASHELLDAMAQDGRGMLFLWPLSMHRYHFPFRPIPDIPTGLQIFSRLGLRQLLIETALFFPLIADSLSWQALWRSGRTDAPARARPLRPRTEPSH